MPTHAEKYYKKTQAFFVFKWMKLAVWSEYKLIDFTFNHLMAIIWNEAME